MSQREGDGACISDREMKMMIMGVLGVWICSDKHAASLSGFSRAYLLMLTNDEDLR
jgi:hypothetical protein